MHQKVLTLENKYELAELGTIFLKKAKLGTNHLPKTKKKNNTHQGLTTKLWPFCFWNFNYLKRCTQSENLGTRLLTFDYPHFRYKLMTLLLFHCVIDIRFLFCPSVCFMFLILSSLIEMPSH